MLTITIRYPREWPREIMNILGTGRETTHLTTEKRRVLVGVFHS